MLTVKMKDLSTAEVNYALSLQSDKAFNETLKLTPLTPIPDVNHTFYAIIQHQAMYSDTLELKTKNGLLDGAVGHSDDKSGDIVTSFAGGLAGLFQPGLGLGAYEVMSNINFPVDKKCTKDSVFSISQTIDPDNDSDLKVLNARLNVGCIKIEVQKPQTAQVNTDTTENGLIYRQPGAYKFRILKDDQNSTELQSIRLNLAQGGQVGVIPMPKGNFSKNEYDVTFTNGMLTKSKVVQPSEALGAAMILPNTLREIFAIPTELIQLKFDYSSSEKGLLEVKKAMLEAQVEIEKKQIELEQIEANN